MQIASPCGSQKQALMDLSLRLSCLTQRSWWVLSTLKTHLFWLVRCNGAVVYDVRWTGCNQANGFQGGCQSDVSSPPPSSPFSQVSLYCLEGPCQRDRTSHAIKSCFLDLLSLYKLKSEREVWLTHPCHMSPAIHSHYGWGVGETAGPKKQRNKTQSLWSKLFQKLYIYVHSVYCILYSMSVLLTLISVYI